MKFNRNITSLSIITPVFNGIEYIDTCIQNVIDQNCKEVEHLIIDGGSEDGTVKVIKEYAKNNRHIRFISEKDSGQSEAMNKGIKMAKGSVISFLNVDDLYYDDVLPDIIKLFKKISKPAFLVGICAVLNNKMELKRYNVPYKTSHYHILSGRYEFPQNPSAYFYHRIIHEMVGFYDEADDYSMDLDFILRASKKVKFRFFDKLWGVFIMHKDSKTFKSIQNQSIFPRIKNLYLRYYLKLNLLQKIKVLYIRHIGYLLFSYKHRIFKFFMQ